MPSKLQGTKRGQICAREGRAWSPLADMAVRAPLRIPVKQHVESNPQIGMRRRRGQEGESLNKNLRDSLGCGIESATNSRLTRNFHETSMVTLPRRCRADNPRRA